MGEPAKRRATYEDLLAIPEHLVGEILDGVLVTQPRPASRHTLAASSLGGELHGPFHRGKGGPGGWIILDEPELHLQGDILVPDIAGWRRERMPELHLGDDVLVPDLAGWRRSRMPALPDVPFVTLAPDWVCEVLSPSTAATDRAEKMPIYARERVGHLWLVDPIAQTLEAYRLEQGRWSLLGTWRDDAVVRVEPFEALGLELAGLWAR